METVGSTWMWVGFTAVVPVMLVIDLFVVGGARQHRVSMREAAGRSALWVGVAFVFAGVLWWHLNGSTGRADANETTLEFITGYLIEKSLAVDNVFVWLMLFSYFAAPLQLLNLRNSPPGGSAAELRETLGKTDPGCIREVTGTSVLALPQAAWNRFGIHN